MEICIQKEKPQLNDLAKKIYEDGIYEFYDFRRCYDIEIRIRRSVKYGYGLPLSLNLIRSVVCSAETLGMKRL